MYIERIVNTTEELTPSKLVEHGPIYLTGDLPVISVSKLKPSDRLELLNIQGLTYQYPNTSNGIRDVDLELTAGAFTVITGQIGSGKSTLLKHY